MFPVSSRVLAVTSERTCVPRISERSADDGTSLARISVRKHKASAFGGARWLVSLPGMPSQLHESHVLLFRNQPSLAAELVGRVLGVDVPPRREARLFSADLTEVQPAEYRADLVVQLWDERPVFAIIVEVQLQVDERKQFVWPTYVTNLRARLECPVCLLVVTAEDVVARWAAQTLELGGLHHFAPYVLGPSSVPQIVEEAEARANPELAVLSAMAHGQDEDVECAAQIARAAQSASVDLDTDRSRLYGDLIAMSLSEAARHALKSMQPRKYEYQSEFARRYFGEGMRLGHHIAQEIERGIAPDMERISAYGALEGRVTLVSRLLTVRFGALDEEVLNRLQGASIAELDDIGERLLSAATLAEALG